MALRLSVIIPVLNGAEEIRRTIQSAFDAGAAEVIVADGGSLDGTVTQALRCGAVVVEGETVRGNQLNAGASSASGDILLFLHADTTLPPDAAARIESALARGVRFGGFRLRFRESGLGLRIGERLINFRSRLTRCPWGDQAQWIDAALFRQAGGYLPQPLMEDYEMAVRMKKRTRTAILGSEVETSGMRFIRIGVLRTVFINWWIVLRWRSGADPAELASLYRRRPR